MKRIVLTMVALMTLTLGFAKTEVNRPTMSAETFDMSYDMRRLAVKLDLNDNQMETVEVIQQIFKDDMQRVAQARGHRQNAMLHRAVSKDVEQMRRVLSDQQFKTYMILLMTTLHNKGL